MFFTNTMDKTCVGIHAQNNTSYTMTCVEEWTIQNYKNKILIVNNAANCM